MFVKTYRCLGTGELVDLANDITIREPTGDSDERNGMLLFTAR